jgi:hypothetical protein
VAQLHRRTLLSWFLEEPYGTFLLIGLVGALLFGDWTAKGWALLKIAVGLGIFGALSLGAWVARRRLLSQRRKAQTPLSFTR